MLFVACCLLCTVLAIDVWCMKFRCFVFVVSCLLCVVCGVLLLFVVCCLSFIVPCLSCVACCVLFVV